MMRRATVYLALGLAILGAGVRADSEPPDSPNELDAYEAVREGNRFLTDGKPSEALALYEHAQEQIPDAREIAFVQGLGHYALGEYEAAREKFQAVTVGKADALADDALYSEGACHHAQALANMQDQKQALSSLEAAMQRYHSVLSSQPKHPAARDANFKAATVWRQLKEQLEQQQSEPQPSDHEQEDQDQDRKSQPNQPPQEQDQDQQEPSPQNEEQQTDGEQENTQQADEDQQERISREQAQRQLREMMQALRQRKKDRREPVGLIPVQAVEKDW